jgi:Zn finger protein HypA/HybF involved in hydrogenase expression
LKSFPGPPATLGSTAAAHLQLIVWCRDCRHRIEPDPAAMAERYSAETTVPDWRARLRCSQCGSRNVDMVVSGTKRR